jgi:hypothetical protein
MNKLKYYPKGVNDIINSFNNNKDSCSEFERIQKELNAINWTCNYGIDGTIYNVRRKSIEDLCNEMIIETKTFLFNRAQTNVDRYLTKKEKEDIISLKDSEIILNYDCEELQNHNFDLGRLYAIIDILKFVKKNNDKLNNKLNSLPEKIFEYKLSISKESNIWNICYKKNNEYLKSKSNPTEDCIHSGNDLNDVIIQVSNWIVNNI